jgi:oligopeptide transport system substrate-binding protein
LELAIIRPPDGDFQVVAGYDASLQNTPLRDASATLLEQWLGTDPRQEEKQADYAFEDGATGRRADGLVDREPETTHGLWRYHLITRSAEEGVASVYTAVPQDEDLAFDAEFERMAYSLREETPDPIPVRSEDTLFLSGGEPLTLDPALTRFGADGLMGDLFSGLVVLDPDLQVRPALASSWDVSPDGTTYTFHLDPEARFHNGRPVLAEDVVFSWERAASPELNSPTVLHYMGDIEGLRELRKGAPVIRGLEAVDPHTLRVTLDGSKPYFLAKLTYPVSWIVDRYQVGFPNWDRHPNGTGPFRLLQHLQDQIYVLERNPYSYGEPPPLEHVVYHLYAGYSQQLYEMDEVDTASVSRDQLARVEDPSDGLHGTLIVETPMCTDYITFNTATAPFDDPRVRQAFAHAVDRERYLEAISDGEDLLARGLLPPAMPGASTQVQVPAFDPELARKALSESSYREASSLPHIVWTLPSASGSIGGSAALLTDMWAEVLGVDVLVEGVDWESYYDEIDAGRYGQILEDGWCADYPDPENFLDLLFHSQSDLNHAHYSNPGYDERVERARTESDVDKRLRLYQEAEQLLLTDSPAIFLTHPGPSYSVWKSDVHGLIPSPIGVPQHYRMWVER